MSQERIIAEAFNLNTLFVKACYMVGFNFVHVLIGRLSVKLGLCLFLAHVKTYSDFPQFLIAYVWHCTFLLRYAINGLKFWLIWVKDSPATFNRNQNLNTLFVTVCLMVRFFFLTNSVSFFCLMLTLLIMYTHIRVGVSLMSIGYQMSCFHTTMPTQWFCDSFMNKVVLHHLL